MLLISKLQGKPIGGPPRDGVGGELMPDACLPLSTCKPAIGAAGPTAVVVASPGQACSSCAAAPLVLECTIPHTLDLQGGAGRCAVGCLPLGQSAAAAATSSHPWRLISCPTRGLRNALFTWRSGSSPNSRQMSAPSLSNQGDQNSPTWCSGSSPNSRQMSAATSTTVRSLWLPML